MARINKYITKDTLESVINTRGKMIIVSERQNQRLGTEELVSKQTNNVFTWLFSTETYSFLLTISFFVILVYVIVTELFYWKPYFNPIVPNKLPTTKIMQNQPLWVWIIVKKKYLGRKNIFQMFVGEKNHMNQCYCKFIFGCRQ